MQGNPALPHEIPRWGIFVFHTLHYADGMNELDLYPDGWTLWIVPRPFRRQLLVAAAGVAQARPLVVLDCGRQFDATSVARAARGRAEVIDRIQVQRAFTCFEAAHLIQTHAASPEPVLVLDLLATFQDENVPFNARRYLLEETVKALQELNRGAGLAVSAHPPADNPESRWLLDCLRSAASQVLSYEAPDTHVTQPGLF
jgi:hypothetical protein